MCLLSRFCLRWALILVYCFYYVSGARSFTVTRAVLKIRGDRECEEATVLSLHQGRILGISTLGNRQECNIAGAGIRLFGACSRYGEHCGGVIHTIQ